MTDYKNKYMVKDDYNLTDHLRKMREELNVYEDKHPAFERMVYNRGFNDGCEAFREAISALILAAEKECKHPQGLVAKNGFCHVCCNYPKQCLITATQALKNLGYSEQAVIA